MTAGALEASGGRLTTCGSRACPTRRTTAARSASAAQQGAELAARWTESVLDDPKSGVPHPAGMILEPVQGEGGVIPAPDAWLRRMREITAARSIPLIADEVQTGVGRTGAFWAVEHSGVAPDVMVLSKAIGGSLPLAVVVYREDLDVWQPGAHAGTFRGNQLAMAAGTATLPTSAKTAWPNERRPSDPTARPTARLWPGTPVHRRSARAGADDRGGVRGR